MNAKSEFLKVAKDLVVSLEYTLTVDGEVVDSSEENGPIEFIQDKGNIIPGLERQLEGMALGESKNITVLSKEAYGEYDPEAVEEIPERLFEGGGSFGGGRDDAAVLCLTPARRSTAWPPVLLGGTSAAEEGRLQEKTCAAVRTEDDKKTF